MKKITPPTIRKLFTEMPKNLKSSCPEKANARMVISAAMVAFLAVRVRSASSRVEVMVIKMVIVPNGLMRVKNEVKAKRPNASSSLFIRGGIGDLLAARYVDWRFVLFRMGRLM